MKKYLIILSLFLFISTVSVAHAATSVTINCDPTVSAGCTPSGDGKITYIPLEPLPCPNGACDQSGTNFPSFVSTVFKVLIGFGGLFAVVMIVIAGIGYMLSESALDISKAKSRAQAALWGLLLLAASWLILFTINPKLLEFNLTSINNLNKSSGTTGTANNLTPAQLQELQRTYRGEITELDTTSGQTFNDQEAQFRRRCEARGGKEEILGSDGFRSTYGCNIPTYMP